MTDRPEPSIIVPSQVGWASTPTCEGEAVRATGRARRWVVVAAALATAVGPTAQVRALPLLDDPVEPDPVVEEPFGSHPSGFDWSVPSRFGRDDDRDGIVDYHWNDLSRPREHTGPSETYDRDFVHPASWPVHFDGCASSEDAELEDQGRPTSATYLWDVAGTRYEQRSCRLRHGFPAQGTYPVSLVVTGADGATSGPYTRDVVVRDLLIVSLGDSYGSGEGNPDVPQRLDPTGTMVTQPARWVDQRCHRSAAAGPAQAARVLEASDPKTSVTFLSFACSGATIDKIWGSNPLDPYAPPEEGAATAGTGVLGPYQGVQPPPPTSSSPRYLPSQLDQMVRALRAPDGSFRTVDALVMSGGGNDAGFAPVASVCVLYDGCPDQLVTGPEHGTRVPLRDRLPNDIAGVAGKYRALDVALDATPLTFDHVYVTEYPDSTTGDGGALCSTMLEDVLRPSPLLFLPLSPVLFWLLTYASLTRAMAGEEVRWVSESFAPRLNEVIADAAALHDWTAVRGISDGFAGHGYCATDPFIRRAPDSSRQQGPLDAAALVGIHNSTTGTLHPTAAGHAVYADRLLPHLRFDLLGRAADDGGPSFSSSDLAGSPPMRSGGQGWLTGQCTSGSCTSDAAVVTVEATDANGIRGADVRVDGDDACGVPGVTCTGGVVDATTYRWTIRFRSDGVHRLTFAAQAGDGDVSTYVREVKVDLTDPTASVSVAGGVAPTTLTFSGQDGAGSGVASVTYELFAGSPGSAKPGEPISIDLGGTYTVRFRAVDHAGRTGPWMRDTFTLAGPTMTAPDHWSGSRAGVHQGCTQPPEDTGGAENGYDGRPVAWRTARTAVAVNPPQRALSASAGAVWRPSASNAGNEDCDADATFTNVPLNVGAGSTALRVGDPVTLTATIRIPGSFDESFDTGDLDFSTRASVGAHFRVSDPAVPAHCTDEGCYRAPALEFGLEAERTVYGERGTYGNDLSGTLHHGYHLSSNREPAQTGSHDDEFGCATWPCSLQSVGASPFAPFRVPSETFTITFRSFVGARHLIAGGLDVFTQAYSDGRTEVSAHSDFISMLDIAPAPGFEGVELVSGDPSVAAPPTNGTPTAGSDSLVTDEDRPGRIAVLANDADPDGDTLTVASVTAASHGTATVAADGSILYTPHPDSFGTDGFTYTVEDGRGGSAVGAVTVTVRAVNDRPVAVADAASTEQETPVVVTVLGNDRDVDGDALHVASVSQPAHGTATRNTDGTITYTPALGFAGTDSITYTVDDGAGATASASVSVTVARRTVSIDDATVVEGDRPGQSAITFTVRLSSPTPRPLTVTFATADGTARRGSDYDRTTGSVVFDASHPTVRTVVVPIRSDRHAEPTETFGVSLAAPPGLAIADGSATGTIVDDDQRPGAR